MFQQIPSGANAVAFIGAGLALVTYGASASVGLVEEGDAGAAAKAPPDDKPEREIDRCIGNRLEVYPYRGC